MRSPRFYKPLTALALLLFFILGFFAVSLAHETPEAGPVHAIAVKDLIKTHAARIDSGPLTFTVDSDSWNVPQSPRNQLAQPREVYYRAVEPAKPSMPVQIDAPKISFQILESVLLI